MTDRTSSRHRTLAGVLLTGCSVCISSASRCEEPAASPPLPFDEIAKGYETTVRPLLKSYCLSCHSTKKAKGDLDLERMKSLTEVRRDPRIWQKVLFMLENGEMPPKKGKPLSAEQSTTLRVWVRAYLNSEAHANAGDPGRVVLRRLSNTELDRTVRDLTGFDFRPTREFPADSAAGEGFTNVGESMVMSPALFDKYLSAAQDLAAHTVFLPDGFRFSRRTARRDQTDEVIDRILALYARKTELLELRMTGGNRDGRIRWGRISLPPYIRSLIEHRETLRSDTSGIDAIAADVGLNPHYLRKLSRLVRDESLSPVLAAVQARLRAAASLKERAAIETEVGAIVATVEEWQGRLWSLSDIGQMFTPGQTSVDPLASSQEFRLGLEPAANSEFFEISLVAHALAAGVVVGAGVDEGRVAWKNARLVGSEPGIAPIALRDVRPYLRRLDVLRERTLARTADYLAAIAVGLSDKNGASLEELARRGDLDADVLAAWADYLNLPIGDGGSSPAKIDGLLTVKRDKVGGYDFVKGWGINPPNLVASASEDREVRIPGIVRPRTVGVHPTPSHFVGVGWRSPFTGIVAVQVEVADAHAACGNGVSWSLVFHRGTHRERLAGGSVDRAGTLKVPPIVDQPVRKGDVLSLTIGPRDANHGCDQTQIDLVVTEKTEKAENARSWGLAKDVSAEVHAGNPHPDGIGNEAVWCFFTGPTAHEGAGEDPLPGGSVLTRWRAAADAGDAKLAGRLAEEAGRLLSKGPNDATPPTDRALYRHARSITSALFRPFDLATLLERGDPPGDTGAELGVDPARFEGEGAESSLVVKTPSALHVKIPAEFAKGRDLVVTAELLGRDDAAAGGAQLEVAAGRRASGSTLRFDLGVVVAEGSVGEGRMKRAFDEFRALFPRTMCCRTVVPIDKVITLVMYHREDEHFSRLLLSDAERERLERLWQEVRYISQDALKIHEFYPLFLEFSTQGDDTHVFAPLQTPIRERAEAFREHVEETAPAHVDALIAFAARAFRRPLATTEEWALRAMYAELRAEEETHEDAFRGVLARIFVSPDFLYRIEEPGPGAEASAVTDWELATRLSYFLWSTMPDEELLAAAANAGLTKPDALVAEARRMLSDGRVRGLATEFACQWLGVRGFDAHDEKNERQYPTFAGLRGAMYEESVLFFTDLFRRDGSMLEILDADHTYLNGALAEHYGVDGVDGDAWQRVSGMRARSRGGVLGMATILSKQSGSTRTSPVLRGNWVVETLLGEKLPDPPATVPELPDALSREGLTVRQMTERHVSDASCASCHVRIDPYGFSLESFDAIGRYRVEDLIGQPVDTRVRLRDGTEFDGIDGLRSYLLTKRRHDFLEQFSRKLLGFALGRTVELTDQPLVDDIVRQLEEKGFRFSAALETILRSKQFRFHRGLESTKEESI